MQSMYGVTVLVACALVIAFLSSLAVEAAGADGGADMPMPIKIKKIYFMFHPVCWTIGMTDGQPPASTADKATYIAHYEWEKDVNRRQKDFISRMNPDEALVIFPISTHPAMKDLEQHAQTALGRRCVIVQRGAVNPPADWTIERFVNDRNLPGMKEFMMDLPADVQLELHKETESAYKTLGGEWSTGVLKVISYSRGAAMDLLKKFKQNGLRIDPKTVRSEAFGEGFEQCAMTWKAMLLPYMGFAKPAPNIFDLSVTGAPYLINAKFRERIELKNAVCLYLWELDDGRKIGFYARSWCRLKDPQYYARVPLKGMSVEIWSFGGKIWPADGSAIKTERDRLIVPVLNGIRRDSTDLTAYIFAGGVSFEEFRSRLARAAVSP